MTLDTDARPAHDLPHAAEPAFLLIHGLRIKGQADAAALARTSGLTEAEAGGLLASLQAGGAVERRSATGLAWGLTSSGRQQHTKALAAEMPADRCQPCRTIIQTAYEEFIELNPELLEVVTAWQVRSVATGYIANDHFDRVYDAGVLRRLGPVHATVRAVCRNLASVLSRFATYEARLSQALARCRGGETEWLDQPLIDSYHTVWFELHEDLLITLGLARES